MSPNFDKPKSRRLEQHFVKVATYAVTSASRLKQAIKIFLGMLSGWEPKTRFIINGKTPTVSRRLAL